MILPERARDLVLAHCLREVRILAEAGEGARPTRAARIRLHAVVVMPDHVHLLLMPLRDENGWPFPLVDILLVFKEHDGSSDQSTAWYLRPGVGRGIVRSCAAVGGELEGQVRIYPAESGKGGACTEDGGLSLVVSGTRD
jgi:hypothetical protein